MRRKGCATGIEYRKSLSIIMSTKKSFALRVDADLFEALERWAQDEFRSVNGQIEWILHQQLKAHGRMKKKPNEPEAEPPKEEE